MVKSTESSSRGPRLESSHPQGSPQPSLFQMIQPASVGTMHTCGAQTYTHAKHPYTLKNNLNKILEVNHCFIDIIVATQLFKKQQQMLKFLGS